MENLYRGMKFSHTSYEQYDFTSGIALPADFIIDDEGRKCVTDGNEYGIYLTTNPSMVENYATPSLSDCSSVNNIAIDNRQYSVGLPKVGVLIEVDPEGLDVKEPYICPTLRGHYNNGYEGKEIISTEAIPSTNVAYNKVIIGPDLLHDAQVYSYVSASRVKPLIKESLAKREKSLMRLNNFLAKEPSVALNRLNYRTYKDSFRQLFVNDCLTSGEFQMDTKAGVQQFLFKSIDQAKEDGLALRDITKVQNLIHQAKDEDPIGTLMRYIQNSSVHNEFNGFVYNALNQYLEQTRSNDERNAPILSKAQQVALRQLNYNIEFDSLNHCVWIEPMNQYDDLHYKFAIDNDSKEATLFLKSTETQAFFDTSKDNWFNHNISSFDFENNPMFMDLQTHHDRVSSQISDVLNVLDGKEIMRVLEQSIEMML